MASTTPQPTQTAVVTTKVPAACARILRILKATRNVLFDAPGRRTTSHDELAHWEQHIDGWLARLTTDPASAEQHAFLRRLLRQHPTQALETVGVCARALYVAFMQGPRACDIRYFVERIVATSTPEECERNRSLITELSKIYGEEKARQVPALLGSTLTAKEEQRLATTLGTDVTTGEDVWIPLPARFQATACFGATGTGKSTMLLNMVVSDISKNRGICLIEPHGDLTRQVIAAMPEERLKDVLYLDITDISGSFSLNLFQCDARDDLTLAKTASFVMHVFEKVWDVGPETPRLAQVLRNTTRVMIETGMTFSEIPLLLWEDGVREKLVRRVTNTQTKLFWSQYNRKSPRDRDELIASTINKVDAYLNEPLISRIVSQSASTIDFRRIMDEGKILLVNLSPQLEEASRLIGAVLIGRLLMAAFSRADTPPDHRRPFMFYCDEYQRFATADLAVFLAEARKFNISTFLATQTLEMLDDANRATALQAGTLIVLRVSGEDSKFLAPSYDATPTPQLVGEEPIRATPADPLGHLVRHGSPHPTVAKFTAEYLMPLQSLLAQTASSNTLCSFGCALVLPSHLIEGFRQLNEVFATCMRERRSDVFLPAWALFCLGGASDPEKISYCFYHYRIFHMGYVPIVGLDSAANRYGRPAFLAKEPTREADMAILRRGAKTSIFDRKATVEARVLAFLRMHTALRETLAVLVKDPILVDTGQFQPKYQLRTYADQENLVANELSQLPNYHAKVRLLSGEHVLKTRPAPPLISEPEVEARIRSIKERMLRDGVTKSAAEVEEEVRKRHEHLRARPDSDAPPPIHSNDNRRRRVKPAPAQT